MMNITISVMDYCHIDEVYEIERACFSMPWSRDAFKSSIDSDNYENIVAVYDGHVVGYAGMQVMFDEAEITNIAVREDMRRFGIATKLLETLELICIRKDVIYLHLEARESNMKARNLYEKTGFVIDGMRKNFYEKPQENAVLMTKILQKTIKNG